MTQPYDVPLPLTVACYVCGTDMPLDEHGEACDSCMNPAIPDEVWYYTGPGDEPGWQDSTFPNEY